MNDAGPPVRRFTYLPTRSTVQGAMLYAGTKPGAALMSDGYEPYNEIARANQLVHLGCWAHATNRAALCDRRGGPHDEAGGWSASAS